MSNNLPALLQNRFGHFEELDFAGSTQRQIRFAGILMAGLLLVFVVGGFLIPIGGAVIGAGQVGSEAHVKRISHPFGGTVGEILVRNGQHVRKGQILVRLDDKVSGADAGLSALSVAQMLARKARLDAEMLGAGDIRFPDELLRDQSAEARRAISEERQLFAIRRSEQSGLRAQLTQRISQYEEQIIGYRAQIASARQQRVLIADELVGVRQLYEKKLVTLNRLNQLERAAVDLDGSVGALNAQIAQASARISETREQMLQMGQTRRSEAGDQLGQINGQLNQQQVRSLSAADAHDRTLIRAPVDGVVEQLTLTTIGGVVRPAEPILAIVPDKDRLVVEGAIQPSDIDQIQDGQQARIRFSSLNNTATPELRGKVIYVGRDRVSDGDGAARRVYFPVQVALDPETVKREHGLVLKTGMPAEIFIETGSRTMISYITKPLRDQFARAFRDN